MNFVFSERKAMSKEIEAKILDCDGNDVNSEKVGKISENTGGNTVSSTTNQDSPGETVVDKMNREQAVFNKSEFFQDLYENYLICVQRNEDRIKPGSPIVLKWNEQTSFDDFLEDALANIDRQIRSIKIGKEAKTQKFSVLDDSLLSEANIDEGSKAVGRQFGVEDYDALYEILMLSKEAIQDLRKGDLDMVINQNTGQVKIMSGKK